MRVVVLTGGTGGAKLAAGLQELIGADLSAIANSGDDIEILGVHVSPDPDLVTWWLSGEIDAERGWGIAGDSFTTHTRMVELGAPQWFRLSDRDLAACLVRKIALSDGTRPTEAQASIAAALGVAAKILPMCDQPVRTAVRTAAGWRGLQEYLIRDRAEPAVFEVRLDGIEAARPSPEVLAAIAAAELIVIGPSNPVISIGPILAVGGMREALAAAGAPVIAVSPFVAGKVVKGPTEKFMAACGQPVSAAGIVALYGSLLDGLVVDSADPEAPPPNPPSRAVDSLMDGRAGRRRLAEAVLEFGAELARLR